MSTKLRLLLDECVPAPLVMEIENCSGILNVEVIDANHFLGNCKASDESIVAYATSDNRILVTTEARLNEKKFRVCTHSGIIVIRAAQRHEMDKAKLFSRFMKSGHRGKCVHAVTKLKVESGTRVEQSPQGAIREIVFRF